MSAPTLLPCPFCGAPAKLVIGEMPNFRTTFAGLPKRAVELHYSVECSSPPAAECSMGKHWLTDSEAAAVRAWNRREASK